MTDSHWNIGPYRFTNRLVLAPMAGVTDRPFRQMCRNFGAGLTVSEMVSSRADLRHSRKSQLRLDHSGEPEPIMIQIAGSDPTEMAEAARFNVGQGAQIIDINMGCPAKKVCRKDAGSALMKDEFKVAQILQSVVEAVNVPVTLKTRTGWSRSHKNVTSIGKIAQESGIQAITVHGRTREDKYNGEAEYDTIRLLKQQLEIPVIANGDIDHVKKAQMVMDFTAVDAIMIGRAAHNKPWIFRQLNHYFSTGQELEEPDSNTRKTWLLQHLNNLYEFYGEHQGIRIARKHIIWQLGFEAAFDDYRPKLMAAENAREQMGLLNLYFDFLQANDSIGPGLLTLACANSNSRPDLGAR